MNTVFRSIAATLCVALGACANVAGPGVSSAPEAVGFSSERLARIPAMLKADAETNQIPGAVLLVARHGKVVQFEAVGRLDPAGNAPMGRDAIFRIASMSKPITTVAAMMLVEEGKLKLDDPVAKYIPAFGKVQVGVEKTDPNGGKPTLELVPVRRQMTVHDLMRHTSGLTYGFSGASLVKTAVDRAMQTVADGSKDNAAIADTLATLPLAYQPGTTWEYGHSTDILGRVIEVVSGQSLYQFLQLRLFDPLGMVDTSFYVTDTGKHGRVAESFADDRAIGYIDPRVAAKPEWGGGGLLSTAADYARFAQMLLNGGTLDGKRYLSPKTVAFMTSDHLGTTITTTPGAGYGFGLGFAVRRSAGEAPYPAEVGEYHWGGTFGTYFWVDPKNDVVVVLMVQSPKRRLYYRTLLHDMVSAAMMQ